jgi:hypothetical protein
VRCWRYTEQPNRPAEKASVVARHGGAHRTVAPRGLVDEQAEQKQDDHERCHAANRCGDRLKRVSWCSELAHASAALSFIDVIEEQ